ncbi:MAG: ABC transporter permease [Halanaerobiales bacterium]
MTFLDRLKLSLTGVGSNKFRSFLTLLGIIIGVSSVIIMVSMGSGTQQVLGGQFEGLASRQIYITGNFELPYQQRGSLTLEDKEYLEQSVIGIEDVVPVYGAYGLGIKYDGKEVNGNILGVTPKLADLNDIKLEYGRYINQTDLDNQERAVVMGRRFIEQLTNTGDYNSLIGEEIELDGNKFVLVGITEPAAGNIIHVPLTTLRTVWRWEGRYANYFFASYDSNTDEKDIMAQVRYLLDKKHGTAKDQSKFYYEGLQSSINILNQIMQVFTMILAGIAAISLLVGGIGVMNIMLVTVKERTREIGVRKAIGASAGDIQKQFLIESILLTSGGGLFGILFGVLVSTLINFVLSQAFQFWTGVIPFWVILLSFGVTAVIGIIFGFYPAYKASKLDPIEALRYE